MKKLLAIMLTLVLLSSLLVGCGNGNSDSTTEKTSTEKTTSDTKEEDATTATGDTTSADTGSNTEFSVQVATAPQTIDPQLNSSSDGGTYLIHLNEGLFRFNWAGDGVELGLAKSVEESEDENGNMVLTFVIREDARWSDGEDLTAFDFEYTIQRFLDPETAAYYAVDMGKYILNGEAVATGQKEMSELGVVALDKDTLQITLEGTCAFYGEIFAFATYYPVRKDIIEEYGDSWTKTPETYITAGPYKMTAFSDEEYLTMEINENYYEADALVATKVTWEFLNDTAALTAFKAGELSLMRDPAVEEWDALEQNGQAYLAPTLGTYYLSFNTKDELLSDVNIRKALTLAIDRAYIADVIMEGTVLPAEAMVGTGFSDENGKEFRSTSNTVSYVSTANYAAQLEEAKAALAEAGYPNGEGLPTIEYMYNDTTTHKLIAEALQDMWQEELGITVELAVQEWNVFQETRKAGDYVVARNGWLSDYNDPLSMLGLFTKESGNNVEKYSNEKFDSLISIAASSADNAERMQAMRDAEDLLIGEDWAIAPIYYYANRYAVDSSLKDWVAVPVGYTLFHLAYIEN